MIAREFGIALADASDNQRETVLVEAMRRDMPDAVALLERASHEAEQNGDKADWLENPNSVIGKQLIRIHAGDVLRELASKHFCGGKKLIFFNCCGGKVILGDGEVTLEELIDEQIQQQAGPIAYADC